MNNQLTQAISIEVNELISHHIEELHNYLNFPAVQEVQPSEKIITLFSRLAEICDETPDYASLECYLEAQRSLSEIQSFLRVFNQELDAEFESTRAGQLLLAATGWLHVAAQHYQIPLNKIWDMIAPAVPDHLEQVDPNTFEAQWWPPVPVMDIEILRRTEGVTIVGTPLEPIHSPGGLLVRFRLSLVGGG